MRPVPAMVRSGLGAVAMLLAVAGCSTPSTSAAALPTNCRQPAPAELPHTTGTLTVKDSGASICLKAGDIVAVLLNVPVNETASRWSAITATPADAVRRVPNTVMSLAANATGGFFRPAAAGTAQLTSTRPTGETWKVTLVIG